MSISNIFPSIAQCDVELDTTGFACPLPLLKTKQALSQLLPGQTLWVVTKEASMQLDIKVLLRQTGDILLEERQAGHQLHFLLLKVACHTKQCQL